MVGEVKGGLWRVASVIQGCIEPVAELFATRDKRLAEFIPSSAFDAVIPGAVVAERATAHLGQRQHRLLGQRRFAGYGECKRQPKPGRLHRHSGAQLMLPCRCAHQWRPSGRRAPDSQLASQIAAFETLISTPGRCCRMQRQRSSAGRSCFLCERVDGRFHRQPRRNPASRILNTFFLLIILLSCVY